MKTAMEKKMKKRLQDLGQNSLTSTGKVREGSTGEIVFKPIFNVK